MFGKVKNILFYWLMIISVISFVNAAIFYWFPIQAPISVYSVTCLMFVSYALKIYYLIPVALSICFLIFFTALSLHKEKNFLLVVLFIFLHCDFLLLAYSFFDAWIYDNYFIIDQSIQIVISFAIIIFMYIYFFLLWKKNKIRGQGDGSPFPSQGQGDGSVVPSREKPSSDEEGGTAQP